MGTRRQLPSYQIFCAAGIEGFSSRPPSLCVLSSSSSASEKTNKKLLLLEFVRGTTTTLDSQKVQLIVPGQAADFQPLSNYIQKLSSR